MHVNSFYMDMNECVLYDDGRKTYFVFKKNQQTEFDLFLMFISACFICTVHIMYTRVCPFTSQDFP